MLCHILLAELARATDSLIKSIKRGAKEVIFLSCGTQAVNVLSRQRRGKDISRALGQVVRLVDQKDVLTAAIRALGEISPKLDGGIEGVVIIANNDIAIFRKIKRKFVWANTVLRGGGRYRAGGIALILQGQGLKRRRALIVVALGKRTMLGIADEITARFTRTDLLLRREHHRSKSGANTRKPSCGGICLAASTRLGGQIEYSTNVTRAHRPCRAVKHRDRLSDTCGGLRKKSFPALYSRCDRGYQITLTVAQTRMRKFQPRKLRVSLSRRISFIICKRRDP